MDRSQKLNYEKSMEEYFDDHKVYDLVQKLFEELIINKPEDPINYLIDRLKRKSTKRIFITGYSGTNTKSISQSLSQELGYSYISATNLIEKEISKSTPISKKIEKNYKENMLIDDEILINLIRDQICNYEKDNISYIIEGFPRNRTQAIFLQSMGILADNIIGMTTKIENAEAALIQKLKKNYPDKNDEEIKLMAKTSANETEININSLKSVFNGFYNEINIDDYGSEKDVISSIVKLLKYKERVINSRCPPKIILVTPPGTDRLKLAKLIANQLKIIPVDVEGLLTKEIGSKNENSKYILGSIENNKLTGDKYVLKLLEDRLYCSDCVINGWIVTGFPKTELQLNYMEKMNSEIKPSLIALINDDAGNVDESKVYNADAWKNIREIILKKDYRNLLKLDGKQSESQYAEKIVDTTGFNS